MGEVRRFQFGLLSLVAGTCTFALLMSLNCMPHPNETVEAYKFQVAPDGKLIFPGGTTAWGWPIRAVSHMPNTYHGPVTDVRYWAIPIDVGVVLFSTLFVVFKVERMQRARQRVGN